MKIDIVTFDENEDVKALYLDGKLYLSGDYYHDHISDNIDGWLSGIKFIKERLGLSIDIGVHEHFLTEESQDKFCENGGDCPRKFPFKKYKLRCME